MSSPVIWPSFSMLPMKPAYSASMTESGRKAGLLGPVHPPGLADGLVVVQGVESSVSGGHNLDVELVEEGAGAELGGLEFFRDDVVVFVGVAGAETLVQAELIFEGVVEP